MKITVYLADDHAVLRDGLRSMLETQADIRVVGDAANGRTAVREVTELRPDIVFMDITMPGLNGIEATHKIIQDCPSTQVIILSMHSTLEHICRALQAGAHGYLLKESAGAEVITAVRTVYSNHRYMSPMISDMLFDKIGDLWETTTTSNPLSCLSHREREILQLVVEGKSNSEIAQLLSLSIKTVETYRSRMMHKLGIGDLPSLVKFAIQYGLTPME